MSVETQGLSPEKLQEILEQRLEKTRIQDLVTRGVDKIRIIHEHAFTRLLNELAAQKAAAEAAVREQLGGRIRELEDSLASTEAARQKDGSVLEEETQRRNAMEKDIRSLRKDREKLLKIKSDLEQSLAEAARLQAETEAARAQLERSLAGSAQEKLELQRQITAAQREIAGLKDENTRLTRKLERADAEVARLQESLSSKAAKANASYTRQETADVAPPLTAIVKMPWEQPSPPDGVPVATGASVANKASSAGAVPPLGNPVGPNQKKSTGRIPTFGFSASESDAFRSRP